jgi:type I restriction enzyme S subunit
MVWKYKKLSEFAEVSSGGTPKKSNKDFWSGDIPWYSSGELNDFHTIAPKAYITESGLLGSNAKLFPKGSLLIGMYDTAALKMSILDREGTFNQAIAGVKPNDDVDLSFILYAINSIKPELLKLRRGVRQKNLNQGMIKDILIPDIPLAEQKRIVALLDTVFADLEQTRAKTEKNLKNARELFDSYLEKVGGEKKALGEFVSIKTGRLNSHAAVEGGRYPFFTCSRDVFAIDNYSFDCEAILLAGNNASGDFNVKHYNGKFDAYQRTYVITILNESNLLYGFLYYQMLKSLKELKNSSVGAGTKFLKIGMIKDLKVSIPPVDIQEEILENLQQLQANTIKLEDLYINKMKRLDELKKSILQKAFSGELTTTAK